MTEPAAHLAPTLSLEDVNRIRTSCAHVNVPDSPAMRGYRYVDVGGGAAPFYLRRLSAGTHTGAITLTAPIELSSGDEAERGAPALARAAVNIGFATIPWSSLLDHDVCQGVMSVLLSEALVELTQLDLMEASECPICSA